MSTTTLLADRTVLVTGGCGGLGLHLSKAFLAAKANVIAADHQATLVAEFNDAHRGENAIAIECDITNTEALERVFDEARTRFDTISVVVNNAGIMDKFEAVGDVPRDLWDRVIAVNLTAPMMVTKLAVKQMLQKNVEGSIVNVSSLAGTSGFLAGAAYTASKHGLVGLTKNTATFYGNKGIRCNAVLPAAMQTNIVAEINQSKDLNTEGFEIVKSRAINLIDVEKVAQIVVFLASDAAKDLNGVCLPVDGGWSAT